MDMSWKNDVLPIFEYYTERTPGSFVEQKRSGLTWHYRLADPEFGCASNIDFMFVDRFKPRSAITIWKMQFCPNSPLKF
jgi:hypothetical protein